MPDDMLRNLLNLTISGIVAFSASVTTLGRTRRRILAELRRQLDAAEGHVFDLRFLIHHHNLTEHLEGDGALKMPPVPKELELDEPEPKSPAG